MKRISNLLLCLFAVLSVTGCKNDEKVAPEIHTFSDGADHSMFNDINSEYYTINDYYNMESTDTRNYISHFATYQQKLSYSCGCCSAFMVLNYFNPTEAAKWTEESIAQAMGSTGGGKGTAASQIKKFFEDIGGFEIVDYHQDHNKKFEDVGQCRAFIQKQLRRGNPIMVDWAIGSGHWTTIIGYDEMGTPGDLADDVLIFADSADSYDHYCDGYTIFSFRRFYSMFHETTPWDGEQIFKEEYIIVKPSTK